MTSTCRASNGTVARSLAAAFLAGAMLLPAQVARAGEGEITRSHGISAFGDLRYPADFPHFDYVNPDAPQGGTMRTISTFAMGTFDSLNFFILKGDTPPEVLAIYDTLLIASADEPDSSYGLLAESLEYPEDRSWVIFNMRPEARFHDGEPVTADDVVFTFNTLIEKGRPSYKVVLADVEEVEALDPHRVKFTFKPGVATRDLPQLVGSLSILPEHYYETVPFEESTMEVPIASGAYTVDAAQPGKWIRYCKVDDYWGRDLPVNVGSNNFECIVIEYFADRTAAFEAFKVGQYLLREESVSKTWATEYEFPAHHRGLVVRDVLADGRPSGTQGFWFNLRREKFQDPRVREAIALMFNFEWTNETLFYGLYDRTTSFWENSTLQATGLPEGEELALLEEFRDRLPPEIFTEPPYTPPVQSPQPTDRAAIRQASRLLDEAGWTVVDGFRQNADGERLTIEYLEDTPTMERIVNPFVANLRRIGIDARFSLVDAAQMQRRQDDFDYDMTGARLPMSLSPSVELRTLFGTAGAEAPGTLNVSGLSDPVVDAMIERIIASETREQLEGRVRALDRVMRSMHIWVPNWYKGEYWVAYWDVFGRPDEKPPYARGDAYWWFDKEKYDRLKAEGALR